MNAPLASAQLASVEALIAARRFPEADRACDAILSQQPGHPGARYYRAVLRLHASRPDEALELLESLLREHPDYAAARYLVADSLRLAGRFGAAAEKYAEVLVRDLGVTAPPNLASRIEGLVDLIARAPLERWMRRAAALQSFGLSLEKSGFDLGANGLADRLALSPLPLLRDGTFTMRVQVACALLAIDQGSSLQWMSGVVEKKQP